MSGLTLPRRTARADGVLLVIAAMVLWSTVPVGTRLLVRGDNPFSAEFIAAVRFAIAAVLFLAINHDYFRHPDRLFRMSPRLLGWLLVAALGITLNYFFYNLGLRDTSAGAAAIISQLHSVATVLLAAVLLGERITRNKVAGMTLAMIGVTIVVLVGSPLTALFASTAFRGNLLEVLAALAWPFYAIGLTKLQAANQRALTPIFLIAALLSALLLPFSGPAILRAPSAFDWGILIFLGAGSTAAAYWLFALALRRLQTSESTMFNVIVPALTLLLAHWLLGEPFHPEIIIGVLLVVLGLVLLVHRRDARPAAPAHHA